VLIAGLAGLVAGAMSMAAGEYVSVHSQADTEAADLERERRELETDNESEHNELTAIYIGRGLDAHLARQVAEQLMKHDALGAHARDELGITHMLRARPIQAALASAARPGRPVDMLIPPRVVLAMVVVWNPVRVETSRLFRSYCQSTEDANGRILAAAQMLRLHGSEPFDSLLRKEARPRYGFACEESALRARCSHPVGEL
jgi:hypothetical protein